MGLLQYTATLLGSSGQWIPFRTLHTAIPLAILLGNNGQWGSFSRLPHCCGVVGGVSSLPAGGIYCRAKPCLGSCLAQATFGVWVLLLRMRRGSPWRPVAGMA